MHILIVKTGALGDVVRTSYFARALKKKYGSILKLSWLTAPDAEPLLRYNSFIDEIHTSFDECRQQCYDRIYSLDDDYVVLEGVSRLNAAAITGAYLDHGHPTYTDDARAWFDMGLLSRYGKHRADELKKQNQRGHAEIFSEIFGVPNVEPYFENDPHMVEWARKTYGDESFLIALNPYAGSRWPSKALPETELRKLIRFLLEWEPPNFKPTRLVLVGAGEDRLRNEALVRDFLSDQIEVANTDESVLRLAALIGTADVLISSDSLPLHLAIAQRIPFVAFFAPTSAAEIDSFGLGVKVCSTAPDYCSYRRDADNRSLTAERIFEAFCDRVATLKS